jgi:signal transduction histidine kinase
MRFTLWPNSLFGRVVLILVAGLMGGQLLGFAIFSREAGRAFSEREVRIVARRIADTVRILDVVPVDSRAALVGALDGRPWGVRLQNTDESTSKRGSGGSIARELEAELAEEVGKERSIHVAIEFGGPVPTPESMAPKHDFLPMPGPAYRFDADVRLNDGAVVTVSGEFRRRPPPSLAPERLWLDLAVRVGVVLAIALLAVRIATRPVLALGQAAEQLGRNFRRPPLPETGPLEVRQAARAFNQMQARLAEYLDRRSRMLIGMSHDLRTPLTRMRLRAELVEDSEIRGKFVADLDELDAMVRGTIDFMRGAESNEPADAVDVMALLESLQADAQELGHSVTLTGSVQAPFLARPQLLKRCIGNLLDNAIKHGGRADLVVEDDGQSLTIFVRDNGPGIPATELENVFEPFYRLDPARARGAVAVGGFGLGLGIARNIADAHGGTLKLRSLASGGIEAVLELPRM